MDSSPSNSAPPSGESTPNGSPKRRSRTSSSSSQIATSSSLRNLSNPTSLFSPRRKVNQNINKSTQLLSIQSDWGMKKLMDGLIRRKPSLATVSAFVPNFVLQSILVNNEESLKPQITINEGLIMIADLSGYTKLSEKLGKGDTGDIGINQTNSNLRNKVENKNTAAAAAVKKMRLDANEVASYGSEMLRQILNNYFGQLIDLIECGGGDVIRVAGDAVIAQFIHFREYSSAEMLKEDGTIAWNPLVSKALKTATACLNDLNDMEVMGVKLQLHIACGIGDIQTFIIGGVNNNWQYVVSGEPLKQIESSLDLAKGGDVVVSGRAWNEVINQTEWRATHVGDGNVCVTPFSVNFAKEISALFRLNVSKGNFARSVYLEAISKKDSYITNLQCFVPNPILLSVEAEMSGILSDILTVSVLFLNIKLPYPVMGDEVKNKMLEGRRNARRSSKLIFPPCHEEITFLNTLQSIFYELQTILYKYDGFLKEFSVDDKGMVMVAGFGAPGTFAEEPASSSVLCAKGICEILASYNVDAGIGIATGDVFCASLGSMNRREYAMVSGAVNLAARFMSAALKNKDFPGFQVVCPDGEVAHIALLLDEATVKAVEEERVAEGGIEFELVDRIKVKGFSEAKACYTVSEILLTMKNFGPKDFAEPLSSIKNFRGLSVSFAPESIGSTQSLLSSDLDIDTCDTMEFTVENLINYAQDSLHVKHVDSDFIKILWLRSGGDKKIIDSFLGFIKRKRIGSVVDDNYIGTEANYQVLNLHVPHYIKLKTFMDFTKLSSTEQMILKIVSVFGYKVPLVGILYVISNDESIDRIIHVANYNSNSSSSSTSPVHNIHEVLLKLIKKGWLVQCFSSFERNDNDKKNVNSDETKYEDVMNSIDIEVNSTLKAKNNTRYKEVKIEITTTLEDGEIETYKTTINESNLPLSARLTKSYSEKADLDRNLVENKLCVEFSNVIVQDAIYKQLPFSLRRALHASCAAFLDINAMSNLPSLVHHYTLAHMESKSILILQVLASLGNVVDTHVCSAVNEKLPEGSKLTSSNIHDVFEAINVMGSVPSLRGLQKSIRASTSAHFYISAALKFRDKAVMIVQNRYRQRAEQKKNQAASKIQSVIRKFVNYRRSSSVYSMRSLKNNDGGMLSSAHVILNEET